VGLFVLADQLGLRLAKAGRRLPRSLRPFCRHVGLTRPAFPRLSQLAPKLRRRTGGNMLQNCLYGAFIAGFVERLAPDKLNQLAGETQYANGKE
jgi:hypothetical protein